MVISDSAEPQAGISCVLAASERVVHEPRDTALRRIEVRFWRLLDVF